MVLVSCLDPHHDFEFGRWLVTAWAGPAIVRWAVREERGQIYCAPEVLQITNRYNENDGISKRVHLSEAARRPGDRHGDSDPEQARASHVRPIAGPGEPSAVQSRPGRVDFKLSVAHSLAGHGPTDSESGRALAWEAP